MRSVLPPAANGTITRTGLFGQSCARSAVPCASDRMTTKAAARPKGRDRFIGCVPRPASARTGGRAGRRHHRFGAFDHSRVRASISRTTRPRSGRWPAAWLSECRKKAAGAPERIRTSDPQIRSLVLYPAELRALAVASSRPKLWLRNGPIAIGFPMHWQGFGTRRSSPLQRAMEHDPEKWKPVSRLREARFCGRSKVGKACPRARPEGSRSNKKLERDCDST